jgi:hypothetical protein
VDALPRTLELPPLFLRAEIPPSSINREQRTFDVTFSTGALGHQRDPISGMRYMERLDIDAAAVRLGRLNRGAPFLKDHGIRDLDNQVGVVVPGSARIAKGQAIATIRLSARAAVDPLWQDIQDGIIRNISTGYHVHKYLRVEDDGELPTLRAIDWEPFEISVVTTPVDAGAQVRAAPLTETTPCVILTSDAELAKKELTTMADETQSESVLTENPLLPRSVEPQREAAPEPNERDEGAAQENERVEGIRNACLATKMTRAFEDKLIRDRTLSLVKAQGLVLDELRKRGGDDRGPATTAVSNGAHGSVGDDPLLHVRAGIEGAILHRIAADRFPLNEQSRPYRGMSLLDVGRAFLNARGVRTSSLDRSRLVDILLTRTGLHTTTDFPGLFEDAANKNLRAAYEAAPQTWLPISRLVTLSDFKPSRQLQVGDAPALLEILEHGEYTFGTIGEAKESIQLKTYGRMFGITRQALINDDLNAFGEVPAAFGRKARDIESDLAWAQITTNPVMGDGIALFQAANHFNLTSSGTVISVTSLGVGRAALRNQKGIDLVTPLNLSPRYLIVPAALETIADQFVTQITPALSGSVNPFSATGRTPLTTLVEPRLDVNSAISWYMATGTEQAPLLYHGVLDGQEGPLVTQMEGFDVDGMKFRCRIDVAFKAADWRAGYKNLGA